MITKIQEQLTNLEKEFKDFLGPHYNLVIGSGNVVIAGDYGRYVFSQNGPSSKDVNLVTTFDNLKFDFGNNNIQNLEKYISNVKEEWKFISKNSLHIANWINERL